MLEENGGVVKKSKYWMWGAVPESNSIILYQGGKHAHMLEGNNCASTLKKHCMMEADGGVIKESR